MTEYEKRLSNDCIMYTGEETVTLPMTAENFCVVFPGEAHLSKVCSNGAAQADKCVFKIRF